MEDGEQDIASLFKKFCFKQMEGCLWRKINATNSVKLRIGGFPRASMLSSGLSMRGFIEKMSLVMTEERDMFAEAEKRRNLAQSKTVSLT